MADERGGGAFWTDVWSFGREILIVVIGVALGLWAQQLVSDAGWRENVRNAKQDFARELQESVDTAVVAVEAKDCLRAYLKRAQAVALGQDRRPLPAVAGMVTLNPEDAAWQAAASSQVLGHLSHKELEHYAYAYTLTRLLRETSAPMVAAMAEVRTLDVPRPGRDLGVLQTQLGAVATLEMNQRVQLKRVQEMLDWVGANLGIRPTAQALKDAGELTTMCRASTAETAPVAPRAPSS